MEWKNTIEEILRDEGCASFATSDPDGKAHMAATWNSYIAMEGDTLVIPAGSLHRTEENVKNGSMVSLIIGSKRVQGLHGPGAGLLLTGHAEFQVDTPAFHEMSSRFPWARAVMVLRIDEVRQLV